MSIITLTSDWGLGDHYIAAVKGTLIRKMPDAQIIDISHNIRKYNLIQTAFIIRNSFRSFPDGSIHIIAVNSEASIKTPHIVFLSENHYFIGADNGVFSLIFDTEPESIYEITTAQESDYFTFPAKDIFAKVAAHIASGKPLQETGSIRKQWNKMNHFLPASEKNSITGLVQYIDSYENAITNINEKIFKEIGKGRPFTIFIKNEEITTIHHSYSDVPNGELLILFGSTGFLEIAINKGSAAKLMGINLFDKIRIEFIVK